MLEELRRLGLSNYETKIVEILSHDRLNLKELSKRARVPFGKIYSIIKELKKKEIIQETNSRPKLIYINNISEVIDKLIRQKQEKEKNMFDNLKESIARLDKQKGKEPRFFEIGTSVEDNKRMQLRSFAEAEEEALQILNIHHKPKSNRKSKTIWEKEIERAIERGIVFKAIYPCNTVLPIIIKGLHEKYPNKFQIKRFDTDFVRCDIIDKRKVLVKFVHADALQYGGVLFIENKKLAENLIKIFNEMWENINDTLL